MELKDCKIGTLVKCIWGFSEKRLRKHEHWDSVVPDSAFIIGHIIGLSYNKEEVIPVVKFACGDQQEVDPYYLEILD